MSKSVTKIMPSKEELITLDALYIAYQDKKSRNRKIMLPASICCGVLSLFLFIGFGVRATGAFAFFAVLFLLAFLVTLSVYAVRDVIYINKIRRTFSKLYDGLEQNILNDMGLTSWKYTKYIVDDRIAVKSAANVNKYDDIKYFKENEGKLAYASSVLSRKKEYADNLKKFLKDNNYKELSIYHMFEDFINKNLEYTKSYNVYISYTSPTGKSHTDNVLYITHRRMSELESDKSLLMSKSEYNKYLKEQAKVELENKQHSYYERVNDLIDLANDTKEFLVVEADGDELDKLVNALFDRTVNSIKKIKTLDSEEWDMIDDYISGSEAGITKISDKNEMILSYYESEGFIKIKTTCDTLMDSQREFNEYIDEKVKSITTLFGTNVVRNETVVEDEFNYIHPYKKSITPFTAELSAAVFASAENSPMEYIVKCFYPDKARYPEQIQKLQLLIEELETLKDAKSIIESYKADIQQYLTEVPGFIMEYDEDGFYSRLGFATINEHTLTVAYKFSYTSGGGKAQRSFTVPMTEDTIVELIRMLESKLTMSAFKKEQRSLMTGKLRQAIKERDDYTCKMCGNSTHTEPNLLLEIDHIVPVSKGGFTEESNLQTLCWKCNRSKGSKLLA